MTAQRPMVAPHVGANHTDIREMILARKGHPTHVLVEGRWAHRVLLELLDQTAATIDIFAWCGDYDETAELARTAASRAERSYEISSKTLGRIVSRSAPDGLVSLVRLPVWNPASFEISNETVLLVADGVQYTGNLGALIRTVDACGAAGIVVTNGRARPTHPSVYTASRGAVLTVPVLGFDDVAAAIRWLDARGFRHYLADPAASLSYRDQPYGKMPTALIVGSEGQGISKQWFEVDHTAVTIPMNGKVDSLNVAVAAAVLLFEATRDRDS